MSIKDPRNELTQVIERSNAGQLPAEAGDFAVSAYETTEDILETIDSMQSSGVRAPTLGQTEALANIYHGTCRWLGLDGAEKGTPTETATKSSRPGEVQEGSVVVLADGTRHVMGETVSMDSPVGWALVGQVVGDTVFALLPNGQRLEMTIVEVTRTA